MCDLLHSLAGLVGVQGQGIRGSGSGLWFRVEGLGIEGSGV